MDSKERLIKLIEENKMDGAIGVARSYREFGREFIYNILKDIEKMDSTLFLLDREKIIDNLFRPFRMLEEGFLAGITRKNGLRRQAAYLLIKSIEEGTATGSKYGQYFKEYLDEIEEALGEQGRSFFEKRSAILRRMIKMANHLDSKGLSKEADYLDKIILKFSQEKKSKEEYEDYAFKVLSKMLTHMAEEEVAVSRENLPLKLEAKPARALYNEFMGHRSFPETNSNIKKVDPSIKYLSLPALKKWSNPVSVIIF